MHKRKIIEEKTKENNSCECGEIGKHSGLKTRLFACSNPAARTIKAMNEKKLDNSMNLRYNFTK